MDNLEMGRLSAKRAVVTGAGNGIGRAIVESFAREGADVHAVDMNESSLSTLNGANCHVLDVSCRSAVEGLASRLGFTDILLNAAAYVHVGTILDVSDEDWNRSFDVNVRGSHLMMQAFLPSMLERGRGSITNIASVGGAIRAAADRYVYGATKGALIGLTKDLALDYVRNGIRANCICPGTILTPSLSARMQYVADRDRRPVSEVAREYADRQPMGRLGEAEEVAALAVYLSSDEAGFCTGGCYHIDGGHGM